MKSYLIQHDFLFSSVSSTNDGDPVFDVPKNQKEKNAATPLRLSLLLSDDGEALFKNYVYFGTPILLEDDIGGFDNPIIHDYKTLLVRAAISRFHQGGRKVFAESR